MNALVGFLVGYVLGARSGGPGFERVEQAAREIRDSEEFHRFVGAVRVHALETARQLGDRLRTAIRPELTSGTAPRH